CVFFFQAEDGIRDWSVTGVQTCALPILAVDRIARPAAQVAGLIAAVAVGRAALLAPLWSLPYLPASLAAWLWLRRTRLRPRPARSEERRVGKEGRARGPRNHDKKTQGGA